MTAIVAKPRRPWFGPHFRLHLGMSITGIVVGMALLSLVWTPAPPTKMRIAMKLKPPLESGLAGTDQFGRDIFSLLMSGAWNSLSIAVVAIGIGVVVGVALGTTAAA